MGRIQKLCDYEFGIKTGKKDYNGQLGINWATHLWFKKFVKKKEKKNLTHHIREKYTLHCTPDRNQIVNVYVTHFWIPNQTILKKLTKKKIEAIDFVLQ